MVVLSNWNGAYLPLLTAETTCFDYSRLLYCFNYSTNCVISISFTVEELRTTPGARVGTPESLFVRTNVSRLSAG